MQKIILSALFLATFSATVSATDAVRMIVNPNMSETQVESIAQQASKNCTIYAEYAAKVTGVRQKQLKTKSQFLNDESKIKNHPIPENMRQLAIDYAFGQPVRVTKEEKESEALDFYGNTYMTCLQETLITQGVYVNP